MTIAEIDHSHLLAHIQGGQQQLAMKRAIAVPLARVVRAQADPTLIATRQGCRA